MIALNDRQEVALQCLRGHCSSLAKVHYENFKSELWDSGYWLLLLLKIWETHLRKMKYENNKTILVLGGWKFLWLWTLTQLSLDFGFASYLLSDFYLTGSQFSRLQMMSGITSTSQDFQMLQKDNPSSAWYIVGAQSLILSGVIKKFQLMRFIYTASFSRASCQVRESTCQMSGIQSEETGTSPGELSLVGHSALCFSLPLSSTSLLSLSPFTYRFTSQLKVHKCPLI